MAHSSHKKSSISINLFNLPPLLDARRQTKMFCEIPNEFFLPDRKNSRLSQIVNTWTFGRLTPDGHEGVGVKIGYLECAYGTKYYIIDQVNCHINAIHDDNIELTELTGRFSPFNLDELEMKVCRLTDHEEDEDGFTQGVSAPKQPLQHPGTDQAQASDSNSGLQSIEDLTGMRFNTPNYSPIPPIRNAATQWQRGLAPTSTPRPDRGLCPNTSDLTHNRGKANVVNSFRNIQEPLEPQEQDKKSSKGGKKKSSQGTQTKNQPQLSTSSHISTNNTWRSLVHCSACGGDHLRKDCHQDTCTRCRSRSHNTDVPHSYKIREGK